LAFTEWRATSSGNSEIAQSTSISPPGPYKFNEYNQTNFCVAALVHDIGHTAFSHVLETDLLPEEFGDHEVCTLALIASDTEIARAIHRFADRAAVYQLVEKEHPNRALSDLISSTMDVDRSDYVLRDSMMTGVENGKYDLSWLLHSLSVELNDDGRPVLSIDGPRGLDALKQFISGRRYLYKQVYFHAVVRGAQRLLKAIFERVRHTPDHRDHLSLSPRCLRNVIKGNRPTLGEFVRTTDVEVLHTVREFAQFHRDPVLRYLCTEFIRRCFPKAVLDEARSQAKLDTLHTIDLSEKSDDVLQQELPLVHSKDAKAVVKNRDEFTSELVEFVEKELQEEGAPREAAGYMVMFDRARLAASPPPNLRYNYDGKSLPFDEIRETDAGAELLSLLGPLTIDRFFVPRPVAQKARRYIAERFTRTTRAGAS
jgi:uncharacterized protein